MGSRRAVHSRVFIVAISAIFAFAIPLSAASASTTKVIYSFAGGSDGEYLDTDLVADSAGNLYGTSVQGGDFGGGTVFQLSPSGAGWTHTVLYSFTGGNDGGEPYKGVTLDPQGNLYGTAVTGGTGSCDGGCGVVFKLSNSGAGWTQSVIHYFTGGNDGSGPGSGLTFDRHGHLYGMTPTGGAHGLGVIYQLSSQTDGDWKLRVIHAFTGGDDGSSGSAGRLILDHAGNLYGVTTVGGANGDGIVFELTRARAGAWTLLPLYAFKDQPDGALPYGGLIFDRSGNLYGTTYYAGANDVGTVYKLTHANGAWTETVLYSFKGGADGSSPISTLVSDKAGNLYGTTSDGGTGCACGVIFKLAHGAHAWTESVPYRFPGAPKAGFAYNGMVVDPAGNFYGATVHGGPANDGTIYKFTP
jgi:uncharacterized repeat protein (TIGR03803 family)